MVSKTLFVALAAVGLSTATVGNYTSSLNMTIDPNRASPQQRANWCQGQRNTCDNLCGDTDDNTCDPPTLQYKCTCSSNKSAPGLQYYQQTMPTFICEELFNECIADNVGNADDQKACKTNIQDLCGTVPPVKASNGGSGDSTGTATGTAQPSNTAEATGKDKGGSTSSSKAFAAPTLAPVGHAAVAAIGMLAVFA